MGRMKMKAAYPHRLPALASVARTSKKSRPCRPHRRLWRKRRAIHHPCRDLLADYPQHAYPLFPPFLGETCMTNDQGQWTCSWS